MIVQPLLQSFSNNSLKILKKAIRCHDEGLSFGCQSGSSVSSTYPFIQDSKSCSLLDLFDRSPGMTIRHPEFLGSTLN